MDSLYVHPSPQKYVSIIFLLQANWVKGMSAAGKFVSMSGKDAIELVGRLEANCGSSFGPYNLKCLEGLVLQRDFDKLIIEGKLEKKVTAAWLKTTVSKIIHNRLWTWLLTHPGLIPDKVHPERGMPIPLPKRLKIDHFPFHDGYPS
jgi:hypothetical protein